jgi:hypothetical protein
MVEIVKYFTLYSKNLSKTETALEIKGADWSIYL